MDRPIAATFACDLCGRHASTVTLVPPGGVNPLAPGPGEPGFAPSRGEVLGSATQLALDGPVKITHGFLPGMDVDLDRIRGALASGDPSVLYLLNSEYAPFWCPRCALVYCPGHWVVWQEMDEGFYDCTRGRCPEGHERILDD